MPQITTSSTRHANQELISGDVQDIISYRPHWLVRNGNTVFACVLLFLLALTFFIQYPDIINAPAKLVGLNPPKPVNAKTDGKLMKLFVANGDQVHQGQHLGYMESTTDYNQVVQLQSWVNKVVTATMNGNINVLLANPLPRLDDLGELQPKYQDFQNELAQTRQTLPGGYYQKKLDATQKDLEYVSKLKNNTYKQQQLVEQDLQLQKEEYKAYESLAKDKVISPLELNQYKSKLIAKEQSSKQINDQITNNDISSYSKEKELLELSKTVMDQQQKFRSALLDLKSQIEQWVQQYVLVSPEDGKVLFLSALKEKELIENGQGLFYVQPGQSQFYAEVTAPQKGLGKVRPGQRVMIKIESYPDEEFGYLTGFVNDISDMANTRDSFFIKVDLPRGLRTSYNRNIVFRNGLSGQAEIVTDNRKLIQRLMGQMNQVLKR